MSDDAKIIEYPIAIKWTIPENSLKELQPGEYLKTESFNTFNFYDIKYHLRIYPNDAEEGKEGQTFVGVYVDGLAEKKFQIDLTFSFLSKTIELFGTNLESSKTHGKWICKYDELFTAEKGFFFDGEMVIKMHGILTVEKEEELLTAVEELPSFDNPSDVLCLGLWNQDEDKDFTFVVDGREITAHKAILRALSPVFAAMSTVKYKEGKENKVEIKDFPFEIVEMAIKTCYHASLVPFSTLNQKLLLLQFYDKYDVNVQKDKLEKYLLSVINEITVCRLINAAVLSNAAKLQKECCEFLGDCLKNTKPVVDLNILNQDIVMELFSDAFVHVSK